MSPIRSAAGLARSKSTGRRASAAQISTTTSGAIVLVQTAGRMSQLAARLDDSAAFELMDAAGKQRTQDQLIDISLAAVITSYTYVEALTNELFLDTTLFSRAHWFPDVSNELAQRLTAAWQAGAKDLSPVDKVKRALDVAGFGDKIDWSKGTAQAFCALLRLRNALIHHEPLTVEHGKPSGRSDDQLERTLHSRFKKALIWEGRGVAFRWHGCLGGPCAQWAHRTATLLAAEVFAAIGTRYPM